MNNGACRLQTSKKISTRYWPKRFTKNNRAGGRWKEVAMPESKKIWIPQQTLKDGGGTIYFDHAWDDSDTEYVPASARDEVWEDAIRLTKVTLCMALKDNSKYGFAEVLLKAMESARDEALSAGKVDDNGKV